MTADKCREVLDCYEREIPDAVKRLRRQYDPALEHLLMMIPTMRLMLDEVEACGYQPERFIDKVRLREKFMRWLGFLQGALYAEGIYTIEQMKDHNRER